MTEKQGKLRSEDEGASEMSGEGPSNEQSLIEKSCNKCDGDLCSTVKCNAEKKSEKETQLADPPSLVQEVDVECRAAGEDLTLHILCIIRIQVTLLVLYVLIQIFLSMLPKLFLS